MHKILLAFRTWVVTHPWVYFKMPNSWVINPDYPADSNPIFRSKHMHSEVLEDLYFRYQEKYGNLFQLITPILEHPNCPEKILLRASTILTECDYDQVVILRKGTCSEQVLRNILYTCPHLRDRVLQHPSVTPRLKVECLLNIGAL